MPSPEKFEEKTEELKEGPEKWAQEASVETFGTEEERRENSERFIGEFSKEREKQGISNEEFKERLEEAEKFLENMPPTNATSLKSVVEIFKSGKILAISEVERKGEGQKFVNHTLKFDREIGLDKFIFMSNGTRYLTYGDAILVINNKILERPDCFVTAEDIADIPLRLRNFDGPEFIRWLSRECFPEKYAATLKEYRKQMISGKDFKHLLSEFIATYYSNPEKYLTYLKTPEYDKEYSTHWLEKAHFLDKFQQMTPFFKKQWHQPEIKVKKEIKTEDINFIIVLRSTDADFLTKNGVPSKKIRVVDSSLDFSLERCIFQFYSGKIK